MLDALTRTVEESLSPFRAPTFRNIQVSVRNGNPVVVTARKGRRTFTVTFCG